MSTTVRGIVLGAVGMLLLLILIAVIVVLTGGYNVAATERHNPIVGWALTTTMTNSVQGRASEIEAPARFTSATVEGGAGEYKAMCAQCHGGVGQSRAEWAQTMRPIPPALAHAAAEWNPEEVFWLVKHGVKMSGMPAFGPTHDDETIWNIAAFVKAMPEMTAKQYAGYSSTHGTESSAARSHPEGTAPHTH